MTNTLSLLIACQPDSWDYVPALARRHDTGVEIGDFADPNLVEGPWRERLAEIRPLLGDIPGEHTLHGPRSELNPGLRDRGLVDLCRERYRQALAIAAEAGAGSVVFHTGFNPLIRAPGFDERWVRRSAAFWRELAEEAAGMNLHIALENVWEPHPEVLRNLVDAIASPVVGACFDVGHANAYSRQRPEAWISSLGNRISYVHLHNNDGRLDSHRPLEDGTVDFSRLLPLLAMSPQPPAMVVEVSGGRENVEDSILYLRRLLGLM